MEEKLYRQLVDDAFRRIDAAFENVDPDLAESTFSQGTLTIVFREKQPLILSAPGADAPDLGRVPRSRLAFRPACEGDGWVDDRAQGLDLLP